MEKPIFVIFYESPEKRGITNVAFEDITEAMIHSAKLSKENTDIYYFVKEITLYGQQENTENSETYN